MYVNGSTSGTAQQRLTMRRRKLQCLDQFLGQKEVWVFHLKSVIRLMNDYICPQMWRVWRIYGAHCGGPMAYQKQNIYTSITYWRLAITSSFSAKKRLSPSLTSSRNLRKDSHLSLNVYN